jgi:hypothetical protein
MQEQNASARGPPGQADRRQIFSCLSCLELNRLNPIYFERTLL